MPDIYISLSYDEYKALETACREFPETVHRTVTGFYHKSVRLPVGEIQMEFHGPAVKAMEQQ